jgi:collagen triple helix repeat protein
MADDARTVFVDGLRVAKDHLVHLEDRLREGIVDLRRTLGLGRIAWGLRVQATDHVAIDPGLAFSAGGVRMAVDSPLSLLPPGGAGPFRVVLRASNSDRQELRVNGEPTVILLTTVATVEADDGADPGPDALVIAHVTRGASGLTAAQDDTLFVAAGYHTHSGEHRQDAQGRWHYDGPPLKLAVGQGPQGASGAAGPAGPAGAKGAKGDKGDPGPAGEPGAAGPAGPAGPAGAKGDAGLAGAAGAAGASGSAGAKGAKGDKGDPGPAGPAGPAGAKGDPGLAGAAGAAGPSGSAGAKGAKGDKGDPGPAGGPGAAGPAGPAGPGLDQDWAFISKVSWQHGATVTPALAVQLLLAMRCDLSRTVLPEMIKVQPQLLQVWFEPTQNPSVPQPAGLLVIDGQLTLATQLLTWVPTLSADLLTKALLGTGGRVVIRIHCGNLLDGNRRVFSAATDALFSAISLRLPGGVLESWFFVRGGTLPSA